MSLLDHFLHFIVPLTCIGCASEGSLLCSDCSSRLPAPPSVCFRCQRQTVDGQTCTECLLHTSLQQVRAASSYAGASKQLVWQLKTHGTQAAAQAMAAAMRDLLPQGRRALIVALPTASGRVRQRGYDQARLIARALARQSKLPQADCLARHGQAHQVGADRTQRLLQLQQAFRVRNQYMIKGADIIVIDDVTTTGASFAAAAQVLQRAGAQSVRGLAFAQTPKR